jgi:dephospho-CoA kinase
LSSTQIEQRIKAQASDAERESISDSVIVNDNDLASLTKQVEDIWIKLTEINRLKK